MSKVPDQRLVGFDFYLPGRIPRKIDIRPTKLPMEAHFADLN